MLLRLAFPRQYSAPPSATACRGLGIKPMHRIFCAPLRYVQGDGVTGRLALEMAVLGIHGPVLVVAGRSAVAALAPVWAAAMSAAGWQHHVRAFGGECTAAEIDTVAAEARALGPRAIVGAGEGKCLDASRAAAAAAGHGSRRRGRHSCGRRSGHRDRRPELRWTGGEARACRLHRRPATVTENRWHA